MVAAWQMALLAAAASLTGVASAVLAVSAYLVVFPVLVSAFEMDALQAVFLCFIVDVLNGAVLCVRYRDRLAETDKTTLAVALAACLTAALAAAATYGIDFIKSNGGSLGVGVSSVVIVMGFAFILRAARTPKAGDLDPVSTLGAEQQEAAIEDGIVLHDPESGAKGSGLPLAEDTSTSTSSSSSSISSGLRSVLFVMSFAWVGVIMGTFGFGGGNGMAISFLIIKRWDVLPSTAASGLLSFCTLVSLICLYVARDEVHWASLKEPLPVVLTCDLVMVGLTSKFAQRLPDREITRVVGLLLIVLGVFAVSYGTAVSR